MKEKKQAIVEWKIPAVPDRKIIQKRAEGLLAQSKDYEMKSPEHFIASWSLIERHDVAIKKIEEMFDPFISGLHKLHKMAIAMRDEFLKPIVASKKSLHFKRTLYEQKVAAEQAERDRKAALLLQAQAKKDMEKLAKAAEKKGDEQTAELFREQAAAVPVPVVHSAPAVPKQAGAITKERWIFEIVDPAAVEREYCSPDPKLIRPVVESLGPLCKISGLKIEREISEHSRAVSA